MTKESLMLDCTVKRKFCIQYNIVSVECCLCHTKLVSDAFEVIDVIDLEAFLNVFNTDFSVMEVFNTRDIEFSDVLLDEHVA